MNRQNNDTSNGNDDPSHQTNHRRFQFPSLHRRLSFRRTNSAEHERSPVPEESSGNPAEGAPTMNSPNTASQADAGAGFLMDDMSVVIPVATVREYPEESLDLSQLDPVALRNLKTSDPFMYYSIPEMRRRSYQSLEDDDEDDNETSTVPTGLPQENEISAETQPSLAEEPPLRRRMERHSSCPAGMLADLEIARSQLEGMVPRRRRVSTEAHSTVVLRNMAEALAQIEENGGLNEFLRDFDDEDDENNVSVGDGN
mmetsp:Transcript_26462/g.55185  ORF Transcript_26462/g.55185 Transcript_26462/m.55185 type:complete len:256 (-) Transcript_26462:202-969(-)